MGKNIKRLRNRNIFYYLLIVAVACLVIDFVFFHHSPKYNNPSSSLGNNYAIWLNQNRTNLIHYQTLANQIINDASSVSYSQMGATCNSLNAYINSNQINFGGVAIQNIYNQAMSDYRLATSDCLSGIRLYDSGDSSGSATTFDQSATDIVRTTNLLKSANGLINQII